MSQYSATVWPAMIYPQPATSSEVTPDAAPEPWPNMVLQQPTSSLVAPDPVPAPTPPITLDPPLVQSMSWQAAAPTPNTTTYVNPLVTAKEIRDQFTQVMGIDTQPPTSMEVNAAGQDITVYKQPI